MRCAVAFAISLCLAAAALSCAGVSSPSAAGDAPGLALPTPSAVLAGLPAVPRKTAYTEDSISQTGSQFELAPLNRCAALASSAQFTPDWFAPDKLALSDLAYALYQFDVSGYDRDPTLRLSWTGGEPPAGTLWAGLSDFGANTWRWYPVPAGGIVDLVAAVPAYADASGRALVALAVAGSGSWTLSEARFGAPSVTPPGPKELWFYLQTNLQVQANVDSAIALVNEAKGYGYTKVVLADSKLDRLASSDLQDLYWPKLQAFDTACKAAGVELVPEMCGIGWSDSLLSADVNLIEGQEVRDCAFAVSGNTADAVQDAALTNGGFENHSGDSFPGWNQIDGAGFSTYADTSTYHGGNCSLRYENFPGGQNGSNDRVTQVIDVQPWHHYIFSFWLKTDSVSPGGSLWCHAFGLPEFKQLGFYDPPISATQDWTQYHIPFNSQGHTQVTVYTGIWGGQSGRFWVDDAAIENAGLINLIRRDGAPFSVTSADKSVTYAEGADYGQAIDPLMGNALWPGTYDTWHTRPLLTIPAGSAIHNGDTVLVNSYHAVQTDDGKVCCCLTEDGVYDIIQANLEKLQELIQPKTVFIGVDELRVANWCKACRDTGRTPGELVADCTTRIGTVASAAIPSVRLIVWSDMYDPGHNAVADYYLCNGSMQNAQAGNPPASWDIGNWHFFGDPNTPLDFFQGRGNRQILSGYYDNGGTGDIGPWLDAAADTPGAYACMYTTWYGDYSQLQGWAQAVRDWEAANL